MRESPTSGRLPPRLKVLRTPRHRRAGQATARSLRPATFFVDPLTPAFCLLVSAMSAIQKLPGSSARSMPLDGFGSLEVPFGKQVSRRATPVPLAVSGMSQGEEPSGPLASFRQFGNPLQNPRICVRAWVAVHHVDVIGILPPIPLGLRSCAASCVPRNSHRNPGAFALCWLRSTLAKSTVSKSCFYAMKCARRGARSTLWQP